MNVKLVVSTALALAAVSIAVGCQSYDFEPVTPTAIAETDQNQVIAARGLRPQLMLLLDKSGSMDGPLDPTVSACVVNGQLCGQKGSANFFVCDTTACPTRWSEMQKAMAEFVPATGDLARMGLALFPGGTESALAPPGCFEPDTADATDGGVAGVTVELSQSNDVPLELEGTAQQILTSIQAIQSANPPGATGTGGGTPAGPALRMLGRYDLLTQSTRDRFVLLLTDGLPNCNPANPADYSVDPGLCQCTSPSCAGLAAAGYGHEACLDTDDTVSAIAALAGQGVKTIVVGFGAETGAASATSSLNQMAQAGGFARNCVSPNACADGESCDATTHLCARAFYQTDTAEQLEAALAQITALVGDVCTYELDAQPSGSDLLVVTFDGTNLDASSSTWELTSDGKIQFFGTYCDQLKASNSAQTVKVEFQIVHAL